jgi:[ribosomal protein S5]-alanine N-acetyltransferase
VARWLLMSYPFWVVIELRPVTLADARLILDAWGRYPENFTHLTARVFADLKDAERYLMGLFPTPESKAFHVVHERTVVGIVKAAVLEHRAQVGYVVNKSHWGKGIATTAVRQLSATLETSPAIKRIWATCALDNPASARVLEKCGFQREAVLRNWAIYPALGGAAFDNYSYVRLPHHA